MSLTSRKRGRQDAHGRALQRHFCHGLSGVAGLRMAIVDRTQRAPGSWGLPAETVELDSAECAAWERGVYRWQHRVRCGKER